MNNPPSIDRVSKNVVRILAQNPGQFTLDGQCNPYILVDTGEGLASYIPFLEKALHDSSVSFRAGESDVSDIIITHKHYDHVGGLPSILALLGRLWKNRGGADASLSFTPPRIHMMPLESPDSTLQSTLESLQHGTYVPNPFGGPTHDLEDGQTFQVTTTDSEPSLLHVIHTPGHSEDSLCLYSASDCALFTGDTVLGSGTAIFEDLQAYMTSLRKLIALNEDEDESRKYRVLYPGHGPIVKDGPKVIAVYVRQRVRREDQLIEHLRKPPSSVGFNAAGVWTVWTLVRSIYKGYPKELWESAAYNVGLHLEKLKADGRVRHVGGKGKESQWQWLG